MNVKEEALSIIARLGREGITVSGEHLKDDRCTATVAVVGVPFALTAGVLSAVEHYEVPSTLTFPPYLQAAISQLWKLGYRLQIAVFRSEVGIELQLEVVLQLWGGGGAVLSNKLTDDRAQAESLLVELTTMDVTLPGGCYFVIVGPGDVVRFTEVERSLGQTFSYVCADVQGRRTIFLPKTRKVDVEKLLRQAGITTEVHELSWLEVRVPRR
ncbi:MAG: hypothetical protein Q8N84_03115 [bacterium]|nr:hypothetical protein [bacterium]